MIPYKTLPLSVVALLTCQAISVTADETNTVKELVTTRSGTTIISNSRNGIGNRIIIDGEEIGVGPTEFRPRGFVSPIVRKHLQGQHRWESGWYPRGPRRWSIDADSHRIRYRFPVVKAEERHTDQQSKLDELVRDPIVRKYVPTDVLELLETLAAKHAVENIEDEETQELED